ncbi:MAG TPA: phage terminase small subunit-related protein [Desulfomonilaceae bacterium]|nr:phage terminase small subunit-related protein [Desulfomonilaceae bacterium]
MKKEARSQAEKIFLKAGGKITNREIAKAVEVNALTVGRWKREDKWAAKLKRMEQPPAKAAEGREVVVRKKAARDKALQLYIAAGGNITNKDLAKRAGVSAATISKWKEHDDWDKQFASAKETTIRSAQAEERELDIGELVAPEQIVQINRRIENLLSRDYLTASEIADLAVAKSDLLEAVLTYMDIVREVGEIETRG